MAETWPGIVVRCKIGENGTVPRDPSDHSPDIITSGTAPFEKPGFLTEPANYDNAYSADLTIGAPNWIYVRGKNFTSGELPGSWNLFWTTTNLLLWPSIWENNRLVASSTSLDPPFAVAAGAIGASTDSFVWVPPDTPDEYCLLAVANTSGHGNPLAGVTSIPSLAPVLAENGNFAQRNVRMIRGHIPQIVSSLLYDQGSEGALVNIAAVFQNIPKGSKVTIATGMPIGGKTLSYANNNTQDHDFKYAWSNLDIPAGWRAMFYYTLDLASDRAGIPPDQAPRVEIRGEIVVNGA